MPSIFSQSLHLKLFLCIILIGPTSAFGSYLRLVPDFKLTLSSTGRVLSVDAEIKNEGDEPARDVEVEEIESHAHTQKIEKIPPGASVHVHLESAWIKTAVYGKFPVLFLVHYRDANGYGFSAPYVSILNLDSNHPTRLILPPATEWENPDVNLSLSGESEVYLKVKGPVGVRYRVIAFSAEEILIRSLQPDFVLDSKGETQLEFRFKNVSALNNSTYPAYAVVTAEKGNGESLVSIASLNVHVVQDSHLATAVIVLGLSVLILGMGRRFFHKPRI